MYTYYTLQRGVSQRLGTEEEGLLWVRMCSGSRTVDSSLKEEIILVVISYKFTMNMFLHRIRYSLICTFVLGFVFCLHIKRGFVCGEL